MSAVGRSVAGRQASAGPSGVRCRAQGPGRDGWQARLAWVEVWDGRGRAVTMSRAAPRRRCLQDTGPPHAGRGC